MQKMWGVISLWEYVFLMVVAWLISLSTDGLWRPHSSDSPLRSHGPGSPRTQVHDGLIVQRDPIMQVDPIVHVVT